MNRKVSLYVLHLVLKNTFLISTVRDLHSLRA